MTTPRVLTIICLFLLIGIWSCEKAERAVDAIDKAAALKDEVRKEYNDVKKELTDKAEQMRAKISKEILPAKDGENSRGQKRRSDRHKEIAHPEPFLLPIIAETMPQRSQNITNSIPSVPPPLNRITSLTV